MSCSAGDPVGTWVNRLQAHINACENCQPHDDGEAVWVSGSPQSVAEFLYDNEVPEELHEVVAEELACGQCASSLQLDTEIVVDSDESKLDEAAGDRFGEWVVEDVPRLNSFVGHLQQSPHSGRIHEVGEDIVNQMKELETRTLSGDWWRARALSESVGAPTAALMGPPPGPPAVGGRFNPAGQRVFYLGSSKSAAIQEARKYLQPGKQVWVQQFHIAGAEKIVELRPPPLPSNAFRETGVPILIAGLVWCNGLVQQRQADEQNVEYLLPQFIAECATEIGIHGILFNSFLHEGTNLVLFTWSEATVTAIGDPERSADPT